MSYIALFIGGPADALRIRIPEKTDTISYASILHHGGAAHAGPSATYNRCHHRNLEGTNAVVYALASMDNQTVTLALVNGYGR